MKRKSIARILALALATVMMTGCSKSENEEMHAVDGYLPAESSTEEENLYGEEVTIRVMVWDRGDAAIGTNAENNALTDWIKQQVSELYNINVEYVSIPRVESDDKLNIMMSAGTAPDIVFTYDQALFYNYASNGQLNELSEVYEQYGQNIQNYCAEAQDGVGDLADGKYAVMKQRGTESARHVSYIRKDWLDELGMEVPTTKEELGEYLYAVKDAGLGTPWAMSGRQDTEKMYLNFVGSYVDLESDRDAYIYSEQYMTIAPGSKEGLKQLNAWYNDGLITQDFTEDTSEDDFKRAVSEGKAGFVLDDATNIWSSIATLNTTINVQPTWIPINCFETSDGTYRNPFEYRHAMFVMIPSTADEAKTIACMKYLNWLADPEVAIQVRYTPDLIYDSNGVAVEPSSAIKEEVGYPGTCDDLCIMNLNFEWVNSFDILAQSNYDNQEKDWATVDWYQDYYETTSVGKFRFPTYGVVSDAESTYGTDLKIRMTEFAYDCITAPADEFDTVYESGYDELVNAGLQKILDARAEYFDSVN